ncbi:hypothetical protein N9W41_00080 [bacterium]|nr:hypothetical protein [bacterium]
MIKANINELEYYLIDPASSQKPESISDRAYELWSKVWKDTYKKLGADSMCPLYSDEFLQREVSYLEHAGCPVALMLHHCVDLTSKKQQDSSYFKNISKEVIESLLAAGACQVFIMTYITVNPEWRTPFSGVSMPDLLFSLSMKRFKEMGCQRSIWYVRSDKTFYKKFFKYGAELLGKGDAFNVEVAYCQLEKEKLVFAGDQKINELVDRLWLNKNKENRLQKVA